MESQPTLQTQRLMLRPFRESDASDVQRHAGLREIADTTLNVPHPYGDGMAEAWIRTHSPRFAARELATFAIADRTDALIGAIGLRMEPAHRRAELGYWIALPFWNNGYASEAAQAVIDYGFTTLGLNRIQATHMVRNPASGRVMQKVGMRYEGLHRQYVMKNGRFEDLARYAILRDDPR